MGVSNSLGVSQGLYSLGMMTKQLNIRVSADEMERWRRTAAPESLAGWVRDQLNAASEPLPSWGGMSVDRVHTDEAPLATDQMERTEDGN